MLNLICFDNQNLEELQTTWEMLNLICFDNQRLEAVTGNMNVILILAHMFEIRYMCAD